MLGGIPGSIRTLRACVPLIAVLALALCAACPGSGNGGGKAPDSPTGKTLTIIGLAEVRGQIEPCGCTTDPLGDLARTARLVEDARARGPTVVLDAGSLLYSRTPVPAYLKAQEDLKSNLLVEAYQKELQVAAIGLGPADLGMGPAAVRPPRQAANVTEGVATEAPKVIDAGGVRVGVFGVVAPEMVAGVAAGDPAAAAKRAVEALRAEKPDVVVALLTMGKKDAVKLLKGLDGVDFAVLGLGRDTPEPKDVDARAEDIEGTWLVTPGNRGQVVSRLEVTLRPGAGFADAVGPAAAEAFGATLDGRLASAEKELAGFAADPSADPAFVDKKKQEVAELRAQRERLRTQPLQVPAQGSYFTLAQVAIRKSLACDTDVQSAKVAYAKAAGEANVAAAKGQLPSRPPKGQAGYVGAEACEDCHEEAVEFWRTTKHAHAWETLEQVSKQFDYECTGCHVTGWDQPGGSNMAMNEPLRDVQCEVCHGPGSLHVEAEGKAQARATIRRAPAQDLCATMCHTSEHSDTFEWTAYMRDIVGDGHAAGRRRKLGKGPTGHELRSAGLERAGKELGAGCTK